MFRSVYSATFASVASPVISSLESSTFPAKKAEGALSEGAEPSLPTFTASEDSVLLPTSSAQQRLWFLDQLIPGSASYNVDNAVRLSFPPEELHLLERSLSEIVQRHESLRTTFRMVNSEPMQVIARSSRARLRVLDLRHLDDAERERTASCMATEEARGHFDLGEGPLMRTTLLRLAEEEYVFLLTMHHIIADGWSMNIFWDELEQLWTAYAEGRQSPLRALPIQYADFASWQRDWLHSESAATHLAYWTKQLSGLSQLHLPTDHARPVTQTSDGARQKVEISYELYQELKRLSGAEGVTLFMTLLAAFEIILHRYSGQDEVVVGVPVAGRTRPELERLIGFFVNILVLRSDLSANPPFRTLLARIREVALEAYAHQDVPFERLVKDLRPKRDMGRNPLFQVSFQLFSGTRPGASNGDALLEVEKGTANIDLALDLWESGQDISGYFEYSTDLFESPTIQRMMNHFLTLLEAIVRDPDQRISELQMLTAMEREQIVVEWNQTAFEFPQDACLHHLVEQQVELRPDGIAATFAGKQLTYAQLNQRANQLAHYLISQQVGPETLVAICMERSLELVTALLGILKAGAAYVPIDPRYPGQRAAYLLEDSRPAVLIADETSESNLTSFAGKRLLLNEVWPLGNLPGENPNVTVKACGLAYVIYTSGSSGTPKGVMIEHRSVCNHLCWMLKQFPLTVEDRVPQKYPYCFDASVLEIFGPLIAGSTLVVTPYEPHLDIEYFVKLLAEERATVIDLVPSLLDVLLSSDGFLDCHALRRITCGGETLSLALRNRFLAMSKAELNNIYGPTEATIGATFTTCVPGEHGDVVPIGRPVGNTQIYILDPDRNPTPIGVPGELHIGGVGLARGYLNRPKLTEEKFIADPFSAVAGARLYKTGDSGRYLKDGNIEYLGRLDDQVKLRGFRIELGEIEKTLSLASSVQACAVTASEDEAGHSRLIAYVVLDQDDSSSPVDHPQGQGEQNVSMEAMAQDHISQWGSIYDEIYSRPSPSNISTFNTVGWESAETGLPIPLEEMTERVEHTSAAIRRLRPRRVLEIGCGAGLLLFRIAGECEQYFGTDLSSVALDFVDKELKKLGLKQVTLLQRTADNFDGFQPRTFDTVILNSVVQCFPSADYLLRMLERSAELLVPGGHIFLGDLRNLALLEAFHAAVELRRTGSSDLCGELRERIANRSQQEEELLLHPAFIAGLKNALPAISNIEIQPKRGWAWNELTRFRYDAVIEFGTERHSVDAQWLEWKEVGDVSRLRELLDLNREATIGVRDIPNARVQRELKAIELLAMPDGPTTLSELESMLRETRDDAVEPEALWALGTDLSRDVFLGWSGSEVPGLCDFISHPREGEGAATVIDFGCPPPGKRDLQPYANRPLQVRVNRKILAETREYLEQRLPEYMIPSAFVVLQELPRNGNGKIDRRALPAPGRGLLNLESEFVAPRTPAEERLAMIWGEVLNVSRVGRFDNFFTRLGGHSLLATQLVSRVRDAFEVDLPLRSLFEYPTVAELALLIEELLIEAIGEMPDAAAQDLLRG
jgi:amino acid adenylation domain-containing protein